MTSDAAAASARGGRALGAAALGAAAGAVLGLLDAVRARLEPASVLPPGLSPAVVCLYAAAGLLPAALAGALWSPATAAAAILAGAAAAGAGLAANHYLLPAFTDPVSLAGDGAILVLGGAAWWVLRRVFTGRGVPGPRAAAAAGGVALLASFALALAVPGTDDGPAPEAAFRGSGRPPDVLLVVVDTLRADAVGYSGAPGAAATPVLDALARESAVFTRCRAPCSWTKPSTASLLTGLYPSQHGAVDFESLLPGEAVTLAEVLRAAGWRTAAFSDNPFVSPEFGFGQGFESFSGRHPSPLARGTLLLQAFAQVRLRIAGGAAFSFGPGVDLGADRILGDGVDFLLRQGDARPAFAYCHLIEPHYPYTPPPPFDGGRPRVDPPHSSGILPFDSFPDVPAAEAATMRANYLGEVSAADAAIGRAVERLRKAGTLDRTLLVVTSDHGEEFHEHGGWTHGQSLYEELVRVPLLLRGPGVPAGRTCNGLASLVDVAPTILELARVVSDGSMAPSRHWTLRGPLGGEETDFTSSFVLAELESGPVGARAIFMPVPGSGPVGGPDHDLACMESWKGGERRTEAFDLDGDAGVGRERPVADSDTSRVLRDFMEREFARLRREALRRVVRPVDPDTRRALEGLGYGK